MLNKEKAIENLLTRNVQEIIDKKHLEQALSSGKKLRVKLGIDPTSPDLHLGHAVVLRKLKEFENLGHQIVLIIGDFTAQIGDPSGRSETRKPLNAAEIKKNMKEYLAQAGKAINIKKAEILLNGKWFAKEGVAKMIELSGATSIQQVLRRADFKKRLDTGQDVSLLEALYPVLQGYDSVKVKADVELGGSDQKLNLLMGRRIQRHFGMKEQDILTVPLLEGTDGERKMSKSFGNYIGLDEDPDEMFGKIMSVPDKLVRKYFTLCTDVSETNIGKLEKELKPRDFKVRLGSEVVKLYHGGKAAKKAAKNFENRFAKKEFAGEVPELKLKTKKTTAIELVIYSGVAKSKSEARRLIEQGAVEINGETKKVLYEAIELKGGETLKIGKKNFFRIKII
ncbi:MAG: tyrosine--tRNA ligase [bacterium]|nr:tyrosine--tRNA ligase [bacterium]